MKKRSEPKDGRKSARKAHRVARPKPDTQTSVLPFAAMIHALEDLLHFYDRVAGNIRTDHGWTAGEVRRLNEIRKMAQP